MRSKLTATGRLVRKADGIEVNVGDTIMRDDEPVVIDGWRKPHKQSSSGRVYVRRSGRQSNDSYFPHVFDLEIVDYTAPWVIENE